MGLPADSCSSEGKQGNVPPKTKRPPLTHQKLFSLVAVNGGFHSSAHHAPQVVLKLLKQPACMTQLLLLLFSSTCDLPVQVVWLVKTKALHWE